MILARPSAFARLGTGRDRRGAGAPGRTGILALAALLALCAGPALAQDGRPDGRPDAVCDLDPETTGSVPADPRSLRLPGERPDDAETTSPGESWQDRAEEESERRRRQLVLCGVD